jgi:hypothetical protein
VTDPAERDALARVLADFLEESHFMEPDSLADAARMAGSAIGAEDLSVYLIDPEQQVLVPLVPSDEGPAAVEGTVAGRSFVTGTVVDTPDGDRHRMWAPLIDGAERVGVIGFAVDGADGSMRARCVTLASLITQFMVTKKQYTDVYEIAARQQEMSLAGEMQWRLLPPLTCTTRRFAIAAVLEPAYDIGGDAFDYAVNGDCAHLAIVDAMGHGLDAAWPATVALSSIRHSRRRGLDLEATYLAASEAVGERFGADHFVTADIGELDVARGELRWINAGHPPPLHVRAGRVAGELTCEPSPPLGLGRAVAEVGEVSLEPWDRVLFFTDGVTEGHVPGEDPFGVERLGDALERETLSGTGPAETMRRLARTVLGHGTHRLDDDFTLLCAEYRGDEAHPRPASARVEEQRSV